MSGGSLGWRPCHGAGLSHGFQLLANGPRLQENPTPGAALCKQLISCNPFTRWARLPSLWPGLEKASPKSSCFQCQDRNGPAPHPHSLGRPRWCSPWSAQLLGQTLPGTLEKSKETFWPSRVLVASMAFAVLLLPHFKKRCDFAFRSVLGTACPLRLNFPHPFCPQREERGEEFWGHHPALLLLSTTALLPDRPQVSSDSAPPVYLQACPHNAVGASEQVLLMSGCV